MSATLRATWLARTDYLDAWRLQEAVATRVRSGGPERLLLLEHAPVYTIGRRGTIDHLLVRGLVPLEAPRRLPDSVRELALVGGGRIRLSDHPCVAGSFEVE